jgi:hypothetical protein
MDDHTKYSKEIQPILITRHWNYCDTQWVPRLVPTGYPGIPPGIMVFYGVQRPLGWGIPEITSPWPRALGARYFRNAPALGLTTQKKIHES